MTLTDHVRGRTNFSFYRGGFFYYLTDTDLEYPIPASDIDGAATLFASDKAIYHMRWIRKHLDTLKSGNQS